MKMFEWYKEAIKDIDGFTLRPAKMSMSDDDGSLPGGFDILELPEECRLRCAFHIICFNVSDCLRKRFDKEDYEALTSAMWALVKAESITQYNTSLKILTAMENKVRSTTVKGNY